MKVIQMIVLTLWMHCKSIQGLNDKISNPCPEGMKSPVADMCMSSFATEKVVNGYDYLDSVVLRAMIHRDGCTCDVFLENHIKKTGLLIEKHKNISAAAPEFFLCGLAIDIENPNDESVYNPIECTNGVDRRKLSIVKNGVLRFTSRIIQGNFTQGYCMHIIRDKNTNNIPQRLKIICNESEVFRHESSSLNPIETKPETHDDDTLFIAIGICVGVLFLITIAIIIIIITKRRRSSKRLCELRKNTVPDSNQENQDPQYDGLKDNVLYVSATQHQDICINYSTVDLERQQMAASLRHSEIDNHYNTMESNGGTMSLQTLKTFHDNETITNNETSKSSNQTLGPPNACSVVYAVVDKGLRNPIYSSSTKIQDDANPPKAYAIVDKTRNQDP